MIRENGSGNDTDGAGDIGNSEIVRRNLYKWNKN